MTTNIMQPQRLLATACAYGLVTASAGFGAIYAYKVGSEHSTLLAILSVLMALGLEGCKPLAVSQAIRCKSARVAMPMACLGVVAIAYSLTAELSLMAANRGDLTAERTARAERSKHQDEWRTRAQAELAALGLQRPSEAIQAELNAILADKRLRNCQGWLANYKLRETCIEKAVPLQAELAKAERREKLEAELSRSTKDDTVAVGSSDPGSAALATYLGALGLVLPIDLVGQWLVLVPVLALEFGSATAIILVTSLQTSPNIDVKRFVCQIPVLRRHAKQLSQNSDARLVAADKILLHLKNHRGHIVDTERGLAVALNSTKATVRRALAQLNDLGLISVVPTNRGTTVTLLQR